MVQPTTRRLVTEATGANLFTALLDNTSTSANGALAAQRLTKVDASGAARAMTIPDGTIKGQLAAAEKTDSGANLVTVTGKIRSTGSSSVTLTYQYETLLFVWGGTFWEPLAGHRTKASIDTQISGAVAASQQATAIANSTYGDDATDATSHFQGLMTTLATAGGGLLIIPRGIYRITSPLALPSNVTVRGEGRSTVLKWVGSAGAGVIYNANYSTTGDNDIHVTDLTVDGNSLASQGVTYAGVKRGSIDNVRVKNCQGYGIWLWAAGEGVGGSQGVPTEQVTVSSCHITDVVDTGIEIDAGIRNTVIGNTIEGATIRALFAWNGATDNVFANNVIVGTGATGLIAFEVQGITGGQSYPRQTARNSFIGNTASGAIKTGLKVVGSSTNISLQTRLHNNNIITTLSAQSGCELDYATGVSIVANYFENFATPLRVSVPSGGGTPGSVRDLIFNNNDINGGNSSNVYGVTCGEIIGNYWRNQVNHILQCYAITGMSISNNTFADAGTANTTAIIFFDYTASPCSGNVIVGNRTVDTRATKWLGNLITLSGGADYNVLTNNSAKFARTGGLAVQNTGTGTHNSIANNIDA